MNKRVESIDVMRGITIFLMILVNTPGSWSFVYPPFLHANWHGATLTDLVFPSFLFVIGLSMSISFYSSKLNNNELTKKVFKRAALIFLIGLLLNFFPFYNRTFTNLRFFGVLQRIALAFLGAGLIVVFIKSMPKLILTSIFLIILHWTILLIFSTDAPFSLNENISGKIDVFLFGKNHVYKGFGIPFDPEGLLGTLSSIAQIVIAYCIGLWVRNSKKLNTYYSKRMIALGIGLIVLGLIWSIVYPINKPLWTGSYVIYTTGLLVLFWTLLIWLIDLKQYKNGITFFLIFGQNPLFSFILSILFVKITIYIIKFNNSNLYHWLFSTIYSPIFGDYLGSLLFAISFTLYIWLFAFWLYKKNIIIKL